MLALYLLACYSSNDYVADRNVAFCEKSYECYDDAVWAELPWADLDDCIENGEQDDPTDEEGCLFDKNTARDCVDAIAAMECRAFFDGDNPDVCDRVCGEPEE